MTISQVCIEIQSLVSSLDAISCTAVVLKGGFLRCFQRRTSVTIWSTELGDLPFERSSFAAKKTVAATSASSVLKFEKNLATRKIVSFQGANSLLNALAASRNVGPARTQSIRPFFSSVRSPLFTSFVTIGFRSRANGPKLPLVYFSRSRHSDSVRKYAIACSAVLPMYASSVVFSITTMAATNRSSQVLSSALELRTAQVVPARQGKRRKVALPEFHEVQISLREFRSAAACDKGSSDHPPLKLSIATTQWRNGERR